MNITILSVATSNATNKAGKPYQQLEVAFKNNTFNKVESKKLMPFGAGQAAFSALQTATAGSSFDITVVKSAAGYNDWTAVTPSSASAAAPTATSAAASTKPATQVKSTYETPEERAKKQAYIIRQSSLSNAVSCLTVGAKSAPKFEDVAALADQFVGYVFQVDASIKEDVFSMPNDMEVD
jgi:hypothetical protein